MELDKKILNRIEKEKIAVRPRWFFAARNFSFGLLDVVLLASFLISGMIMIYFYSNFGEGSFLSVAFLAWALLLAVSLFGILQINRKISSLYKLRLAVAVPILLIANSAFGFYSNQKGLADNVEAKMEKTLPAYEKMISQDFKTVRSAKQETGMGKEGNQAKSDQTKSDQSENQQMQQPGSNPASGQGNSVKNNGMKGNQSKPVQNNSNRIAPKKMLQNNSQQGNGNGNGNAKQITKGNVFKMMKYF
jgi:hypothetical protein